MSWELIVKDKFASAHFLENYQGKCEKLHGHTFGIEVFLKGETLDKSGIAIDFTHIKKFIKGILPDHKVLNEEYSFSPSAENLAKHFYQVIKEKYQVVKVIVWESDNAGASYSE